MGAFITTAFRTMGSGIAAKFSGFTSGAWSILPPALSEALQWMLGTSNGETMNDNLDPVIMDLAAVGDVTVLDFDGTNIVTGQAATQVVEAGSEICASINTSVSSAGAVVANGAAFSGGKRFYMAVSLGKLVCGLDDNSTFQIVQSTLSVSDGNPHFCSVVLTSNTVLFTVDENTEELAHTTTLPFTPNGDVTVGGLQNIAGTDTTDLFEGMIWGAKIQGCMQWSMQEGAGIAVFDVSGNGNHGELGDGVTPSTYPTWTTADGIPSHNQRYGHTPSVGGDGVGAYIDLGVEDNGDLAYEISGRVGTLADAIIIGLRDGSVDDDCYIGFTTSKWRYGYGSAPASDVGVIDMGSHVLKLTEDGKGYLDGVMVVDRSGYSRTNTGLSPYLYARNLNGSDSKNSDFSSYRVKVWKAGVLVRDMIPYGEAGKWFDLVNSVIYSNDGTGTLSTKYIPALPEKTKSVLFLDAGTDEVALNTLIRLPFNEVWSMNIVFCPSAGTSGHLISDTTTSAKSRVIYSADIYFRVQSELSGTDRTFTGMAPSSGVYNDCIISSDGTGNITVDNGTTSTTLFYALNDAFSVNSLGAKYGTGTGLGTFQGKITLANINEEAVYDFTTYEGKATTVIVDSSGNGNDGTLTTASLDVSWGKRIVDPGGALVDAGSYLALTNPSGYANNGFEGTVTETDTDFTILDGVSYWGNNVDTWTPRTYAEDLLRINGTDGLWDQWEKVNGVCLLKERYQLPVSMGLTLAQYRQAVRWAHAFTDECGAGTLEIAYDLDGTIQYNEDGSMELVQPT